MPDCETPPANTRAAANKNKQQQKTSNCSCQIEAQKLKTQTRFGFRHSTRNKTHTDNYKVKEVKHINDDGSKVKHFENVKVMLKDKNLIRDVKMCQSR